MPRRKREETQPEVKQEVKLEYDIPMPFNDASSSSAASSITDPKYSYLLHPDLSELEGETKAIFFKKKIGFKALLKLNEAALEKVGIAFGEIVSLLAFAEDCKKNGNVVPVALPPPPPLREKTATDGFAIKLIQAFDPSISQSSLQTVFKHLRVATTEFWMLSDNDFVAILRDAAAGKNEATKIFNAQQYLINEEHWNEIRIVVDSTSVETFLSKKLLRQAQSQAVDCYRVPEFVSQLVKITPKKSSIFALHCLILRNFAHFSEEGQKLLGRQEIVDSLVSSSRYTASADDVCWWSTTVSNLSDLESHQKLFGCSSIRDSLVTISKYATTDDAVSCWSRTICQLTFNSESNRKLFGCSSIRDCFAFVSKYATTSDAVCQLFSAIDNITCSNDVVTNRIFSRSAEFKEAFFSLKRKLGQKKRKRDVEDTSDEDTSDAKLLFGWIKDRLF